ncbi:MAG: thioredoxin domain-containing protein [Candidatus Curtissbacteria bacterium]|nr:thioredoxin domain-containing protein [Candidatus Curtissbacteria bacterium]
MSKETKFLIGVGLVTLAIITFGAFIFGNQKPGPSALGAAQIDLIQGAKHAEGTPSAKVKIVEFGDFQCPACAVAHPIVKLIIEKNKDKIYFVFRNFPLPSHANAVDAARAAEAAGEQGKYWGMYDLLYQNQKDWSDLANPSDKFKEYAQKLELDLKKFNNDLAGGITVINSDKSLGEKAGVKATPTFFINGQEYEGVITESDFQKIIDQSSQ